MSLRIAAPTRIEPAGAHAPSLRPASTTQVALLLSAPTHSPPNDPGKSAHRYSCTCHVVPVGQLVTVSAGELVTVSAGELATVSAGELVTVSAGELVTVSAGELVTVPVGQLVTVSAGSVKPSSSEPCCRLRLILCALPLL
eukprot:361318-Chlamydomonas_euryale.AAC.3